MANKMKYSLRTINIAIVTICIIGFVLSTYAYLVELAKEEDNSYKPMCDINEYLSCTKAFNSEYGKGFGLIPETSIFYLPNPLYGIMFYTCAALLSVSNMFLPTFLITLLAGFSNTGTIYLVAILFLQRNICVVCVSLYLVNALLFVLSVKKLYRLRGDGTKKRKVN